MAKRKTNDESFTIPQTETASVDVATAVAIAETPTEAPTVIGATLVKPQPTMSPVSQAAPPAPIEPSQRCTVREALNKIYHKGFYFDGFARPGDGLVQFLRMLGRTGVRRDERGQPLLEQHAPLVAPLLAALDELVPDWFQLAPEGNAIGPEPFAPPGPADELIVRQMSGGVMVIVPLPLNGERPFEINLGPVVIDRTRR